MKHRASGNHKSLRGRKDLQMKTQDWNRIVGENIRRFRTMNGEAQEALGEFLGYGATTIANYEAGDRMPDLVTAYLIAKHYEITMENLMTESHDS